MFKGAHMAHACYSASGTYSLILTGALDEELLSVAAQQGPRQEGSKVDKDLPEKRSRLLQSVLQTLRDAESARRQNQKIISVNIFKPL